MSPSYQTLLKFRCKVSKTQAELKSETKVILNGFDELPMSKQQVDAAVEMLQAVSNKMREATPEELEEEDQEEGEEEEEDDDDEP